MTMPVAFAHVPNDTDEERLAKKTIFMVAGSCTVAGGVWTVMYLVVFGPGLTATLPFIFVAIVGASLVMSHASRNIAYAVYAEIICIIYITAFIQWSIGGIFDSGFVLAWAICGPISALIFPAEEIFDLVFPLLRKHRHHRIVR